MAFYHLQTSNHLAEDVLLLIFDHLNVRDLMKCEAVCSQWRRVLLTETPWRRLFRRLIRSSICWQRGWRNLKIDAEGTQAVSHRALCKTILQQLKEVYRNWSSANFKELFVPIKFWRTRQQSNNRSLDLKLGNDCIAVRCFSGRVNDHIDKILFVDGRSQVLREFPCRLSCYAETDTNITVRRNRQRIILVTSGRRYRLQSKLHDFDVGVGHSKSFCLWSGQLAVLSKLYQLNVWDTTNPLRLTRVKRRYVRGISPARPMTMKMDDKFIVVSGYDAGVVRTTIFFFISSETLELKGKREMPWARVDEDRSFVYENGLLLVFKATKNIPDTLRGFWGSIRMYDVASDTFIRDIPVGLISIVRFDLEHFVGFNSRFMIVSSYCDDTTKSKLKIYDLEAIKNPGSKEDRALIRTLYLNDTLHPMAVDDKQIVCSALGGVRIFEFDSQ